MEKSHTVIADIETKKDSSPLHIYTMGQFHVERQGEVIGAKDWGRDKTIQLFQFLITVRHQRALHKEQIIDRLWPQADQKGGDRDFKVALHGVNKTIEPDKSSRAKAKYIARQGLSYQLLTNDIWIDTEAMEQLISIGNRNINDNQDLAKEAFYKAIDLHKGTYLPNRLFNDWCAEERERLQVLSLAAYVSLAELILEENPMESLRLSQQALLIDSTWEDAYRIQMSAYHKKGNRPAAIKTYKKCAQILDKEYGIEPLPITKQLIEKIKSK